jgi:diguanylate cyclase (GGDEF)-like protein
MSPFVASVKEFWDALKKRHTYDPVNNNYLWFGFFLGATIPFLVLWVHLYAMNMSFKQVDFPQLLHTYPLYWIFLLHPVMFAIVFGTLGTIHKLKETKINDLLLRLKVESTHDSLTKLYNRAFFELILQQEITRSSRQGTFFCVVIFDIDHFKNVNDHYGHLVGDRVLRTIGLLLRTHCRTYDTASRWGGEEFSLILPSTSLDDALRITERIRIEFSQISHSLPKTSFSCTLSAGIANYIPGDNMTRIIEKADQALYDAKFSGRNCVTTYKI